MNAERSTRPPAHNSNPLIWLRNRIKTGSSFDRETRGHALAWLNRMRTRVGDDLLQTAVARSAVFAYARVTQLEDRALTLELGSPDAEANDALLIRWQGELVKQLRTLGLSKRIGKSHQAKDSGKLFSPPREQNPADTRAEAVA